MSLLHSNIIGEGQPFVILHGFLGMGDNWKTLAKGFSLSGFQMHLVDQRNHGRSFHNENFSQEIMVEDLKSYCKSHQLDEIILLGHSMGGKVAMLFAATYPELVTKLIIADIAPRFYPTHHDSILTGLAALNFEQISSRSEADSQLAQYVDAFGIRQFLLKNLYWIEKGKLALRLNLPVLIENVDEIGEAMPLHLKFEGPTLFLKGDRSEYISDADSEGIKIQFPMAMIETIENSGHWLHAENPKDFFDVVSHFIDR